jgi:radical SAM protein with 4Fe4S-binding SPASM domain
MKMNAAEMGDILPALFEAGVSSQKIRHWLTAYVPVGRALTESFEPTPAERAVAYEAWCDAGRVVWAGAAVPLWVPRDEVEEQCAATLHGCTAGKQAVVNSEGDVYPCAYLGRVSVDYILGNVREQDFRSIWRHNEFLPVVQDFRSSLVDECAQCFLKETCGGCRARAVLATKQLGDADPWARAGVCSAVESRASPQWARC